MSVVTQKLLLERDFEHHGFDVASLFLLPNRPWLSLYGLRLPCLPSLSDEHHQSPIQKKLPQEIMLKLFSRLGPYGLGVASCVCRQWNILAQQPQFWYRACLDAFAEDTPEENVEIVKAQYNSSWKRMFLCRPHLRFDGMYVARNTYLRTGIAEWRERKAVHLVTYFRYLRFWPGGRFRYSTTPVIPRKVAAFLGSPLSLASKCKEPVTLMTGDYIFDEGWTTCNALYPKTPHIRFQITVRLRSTAPGANNRLDVQKIITTDVGQEGQQEEEDVVDYQELEHQRGRSSFVFVAWEHIDTCLFNKPQDIDYHIA